MEVGLGLMFKRLNKLIHSREDGDEEKLVVDVVDIVFTGEIPSFKLFESERVFAFLDIQPLSRGHAVCMDETFFFFFFFFFGQGG